MAFFLRYRIPEQNKQLVLRLLRGCFWFSCGVFLGLFFFISFIYIFFKVNYANVIYPGVYVDNRDFGGQTKQQVVNFFETKNIKIQQSSFFFTNGDYSATVSAKELNLGYDTALLVDQIFSVGRASNILANFSLIIQAYLNGVYLPPSYHYNQDKLAKLMEPFQDKIYLAPVDARFSFQNGKVNEFRPSLDGQELNLEALNNKIAAQILTVISVKRPHIFTIIIPIKVLKPTMTTDKVNNLGIQELIGVGTSMFDGSIPNRIYNITLASTRLNGILIKPGETFSFDNALGDVSAFTGYKQAYVIQNGRTVLGDGGGVCQVSTTFFRAALNAGLPIIERNPHAYRVGYYEQDQGPGFDAAIFSPTVDFKFKNDTTRYLLVQTIVDPGTQRLTFELFGTKDNRQVLISQPVITNVTSSPDPLYIDDPTLAKGEIKQVDYAVSGANVYFTRIVKKDGKVILNDKFASYYRAWQAVYMRGTKE
jgi:vancomycin resistance protein YoaR